MATTSINRERTDEGLQYRVIQHKSKWYVGIPSSDSETWTAFTGNTATIYRDEVSA